MTDHNNILGSQKARNISESDPRFKGKIIVIEGLEYTNCRVHMNIFGLNITRNETAYNKIDSLLVKKWPTDQDLIDMINAVHELEGFISINHIPWSTEYFTDWAMEGPRLQDHPTRSQLISWGIDFIEVVNQNVLDFVSFQLINQMKTNASGIKAPGMLAGSDIHYPDPPKSWTVLKADEYSRESILKELKARRTSFLFDAAGPVPVSNPSNWQAPNNPKFDSNTIWYGLGFFTQLFYEDKKGMYSFIVSFFTYILLQDGYCKKEEIRPKYFAIFSMVLVFLFNNRWAIHS